MDCNYLSMRLLTTTLLLDFEVWISDHMVCNYFIHAYLASKSHTQPLRFLSHS